MTEQLVLSLFPGIGLLDMAFEAEGFCVVRGPDVLWGGDIRRFRPPAGRFDGIIGGPPCQSFSSLAHLIRANGHEPKFGNLIPEYERCVREALPTWFVMENVPQAPEPEITGYGVRSFLLDNSALEGGDGFGLEQRRVRRFSFGLNADRVPPSLLRWIEVATFLLPDAEGTVTSSPVDNSAEAKGRKVRGGPVTATHDSLDNVTEWSKRRRERAVSSSSSGAGSQRPEKFRPDARTGRVRLTDACRLQGLPEDFLSDAPFTAEGKLKAVANGVPLPMGRAIARAVREAITEVPP